MTKAIRMLLAEGLITKDQYDGAVLQQAGTGGTLGYHLVERGAIHEDNLVRFLAQRFPVNHWPKNRLASIAPSVIFKVPRQLAISLRVLPLQLDRDRITLGVTDPTNSHAVDEVARYTGMGVIPAIVSERDMTWALDLYYQQVAAEPAQQPLEELPTDEPVPLTVRVTREFASLGAPPDVMGPGEPEPSAQDSQGNESPSSLEDAFRAIPLINRSVVKSPITPRSTASFARPSPSSGTSGKVVAQKPILLEDTDVAPSYDSWSRPAAANGSSSATSYILTSKKPEQEGPSAVEKGTTLPAPEDLKPTPTEKRNTLPRRRTEGELIAAMNSAYNRDAIVSLALEHLMRFAKRAAFLIVSKREIRGFDITGDLTSREAAKTFWVPLSTPSTLSRVAHDKQIHLGPIGRSPADSVLSAALGGRPERALVLPIVLQDKTIGLLYADRIDVDVPPWSRLERLAESMADNLAKILRRGRNS